MDKIKIYYTSTNNQRVISWLDNTIRLAAKKAGYEFIGSGYDFIQMKRDMEFEKIIKDSSKKKG